MANAYTLVQALQAAGKNLTRQDLINAINKNGATWMGPGLVPFRYSTTDHGGYSGAEMGQLKNGAIQLMGGTADHHAGRRQRDHTVHRYAAGATGERNPDGLTCWTEGWAAWLRGWAAPSAARVEFDLRRRRTAVGARAPQTGASATCTARHQTTRGRALPSYA